MYKSSNYATSKDSAVHIDSTQDENNFQSKTRTGLYRVNLSFRSFNEIKKQNAEAKGGNL